MSKNVNLLSQEGTLFQVPFKALQISNLLNNIYPEQKKDIRIPGTQQNIRIPGVSTKVLEKIIEFCTKYQEDPMKKISKPLRSMTLDDEVGPWYANFINVEKEMIFEITEAANFMQIDPLIELTCAKIASLIQVS